MIRHSEEGAEAGNKKLRYDREHHTRKDSNKNVNKDMFVRAMVTGEIEIAHEMAEFNKKKRKSRAAPTLPILPTMARSMVKNPSDFLFEDPYEADPDPDLIHLADTDDEGLAEAEGGNEIGMKCHKK